jgi:hypothetical protein
VLVVLVGECEYERRSCGNDDWRERPMTSGGEAAEPAGAKCEIDVMSNRIAASAIVLLVCEIYIRTG